MLLADNVNDVFGNITAPSPIQPLVAKGGAGGLSFFLSNVVALIYTVAGIVFLFMIIISGLQWLTSGGDKEAVSKARNRLIYAIVGITILAFAFFIVNVVGQLLGFTFFK